MAAIAVGLVVAALAPPSLAAANEHQEIHASLINPFDIIGAAVDPSDRSDVPIRYGQNVSPVFGIRHSGEKHNVINVDAVRLAVEFGYKDKSRGRENPNYRLEAHNTADPSQRETFVVGAYTGNVLAPVGPTPDGRPVEMITAFCEGKVECPGWVNRPGNAVFKNSAAGN